jgi:hypothetical protein
MRAVEYTRETTALGPNFSYANYTLGNALVFAGKPVKGGTLHSKRRHVKDHR